MIKKEVFLGFIISIVVTVISMFLYLNVISDLSFKYAVLESFKGGVLQEVVTLSALPNLLLFFLFLNTDKEYRARGVLWSIIITSFVVFFLKVS